MSVSGVVSFSGLYSGIDWNATIDALMEVERRPVTLLERRRADQQLKLDAWTSLEAKLTSLMNLMEDLEVAADFLLYSTSSSDSDKLTAGADSGAVEGTYGVVINRLATSSRLIHQGWADSNTTAVNSSGSGQQFVYVHGTGGDAETVSIDVPDGTTLAGLVELINNDEDNPGLRASIINDGSGGATAYHLVLSSTDTGSDTLISIDDAGTTLGDGGNFDQAAFPDGQTGVDAQIRVDGYPPGGWIESSSNSVSDVVDGVTFNLLDTTAGEEISLTVLRDEAGVKSKIQSFVDAYNEVLTLINAYESYDSASETMGPLLGDSGLILLERELDRFTNREMAGLPDSATFTMLAEIGITTGEGGLLEVDSTTLDEALEDHFDAVKDLFTFSSRSDSSNLSYFTRTSATEGGDYSVQVQYDASGSILSATIDGEAATVDGGFIVGAEGGGAEGLRLRFTDPGDGPGTLSATVSLGMGVAASYYQVLDTLMDPDEGHVQYQTDRIEDSIESLTEQISDLESRLELVRQQYEREFTTLESMLAQLQSQSNFLTAQFSGNS